MTITASQVKELRERTGAGMMECKKALEQTHGNIESAIELMRKAGIAKAAKKADRIVAEGIIVIKTSNDQKTALMIEVNCETDFVARDQNFTTFADNIAARALAANMENLDGLLTLPYQSGSQQTIEQVRHELVAKLGENIKIRRLVLMNAPGIVGHYRHGNRIGVLVQLDVANQQLGKDLAMHIAASKPITVSPDSVPAAIIATEKEIFVAQAATSGKSPEIIGKMVEGRIKKFVNEVSLLGQPYVKNPSETVGDLLKAAKARVLGFERFEVGEGVEKTSADFAKEVMAQVKGS